VDIGSAELTLTGKSVFSDPKNEFLDKIYLNDIEIGPLNAYISAGTPDSVGVNISIPIHPSFFNSGNNAIKISAGHDANGSNYDDFEFYNLSLNITEIEPATVAPPLKVAWTHKFPWRMIEGVPEFKFLTADGVIYICEGYSIINVTAMDAETGKVIWDKEFSEQADLEYKHGVLFAIYSSTVDALNAKTGKLLWSQQFLGSWPGEPLIFGNILFVNTLNDIYVTSIDTENGSLKWVYGSNSTDSEAVNISNYYLSGFQANGNILVFKYGNFDGPDGLIALDARTGKEVWRYANLREYSLDPLLYKNRIYVAGEEIIALSAESGEEVWRTKINGRVMWAEVKNNKLYFEVESSKNSPKSVVLDINTGKVLENSYSPLSLSYSPGRTDEYLYATDGCKIITFNSSTGKPVWSSSRIKGASISGPVVYKDRLYLVSSDGVLYAFEHGEGSLFFTEGLEDSAVLYLPPIVTIGMFLLLAVLLRKNKNRALVFGPWLIAFVVVLLISFLAIQPYFIAWDVFGILTFLILCSMALILIFGFVFLIYGIRKGKK
jgi:outer membrane protein assembly factor BamB